jgi:hypothetical protein
MMRLGRASVIVTLFLLAWAATASAECAWVLWQSVVNLVPGGSQEWGILQATRDETTCNAIRYAHLRTFKPSDEWSRVQDALVYKPRDGSGGFSLTRICLPDTVDPRGPKGK